MLNAWTLGAKMLHQHLLFLSYRQLQMCPTKCLKKSVEFLGLYSLYSLHMASKEALGHSTLLYTTLCYSTLLYAILLYCTLCYATLHYSTQRYSTLHYTTLPYSTLCYSTLRYSTLPYSTLRYSTLLYSTRLDSTLLYATLRYSALLYAILLYIITQVFLAFWLVLAYDLLEDRCTIDVIITEFLPLPFYNGGKFWEFG